MGSTIATTAQLTVKCYQNDEKRLNKQINNQSRRGEGFPFFLLVCVFQQLDWKDLAKGGGGGRIFTRSTGVCVCVYLKAWLAGSISNRT